MKENQDIGAEVPENKEVDLLALVAILWANWRKIFIWSIVGAVVGVGIGFSIPKEYSATAKLVPEAVGNNSGNFSTLASMAGLGNMNKGDDAVGPELYPDVFRSIPFLISLFDVKVETIKGEKLTVREFLEEEKIPWWSHVLALPSKLLGVFKKPASDSADHTLNSFRLTQQENKMVKALSARINGSYDEYTFVLTINVKMQDPLVAAMLADSVVSRLQDYVTIYRTGKARKDLEYTEQINAEAQQEYYRAQKALADYSDRNQGLATQSARITHDRLENEAQLAFALYNQTAQRVQAARALVQEKTPVCVVFNPPTVPLAPSSPRKVLILIVCAFLGMLASSVWILFVEPIKRSRKEIALKAKN